MPVIFAKEIMVSRKTNLQYKIMYVMLFYHYSTLFSKVTETLDSIAMGEIG